MTEADTGSVSRATIGRYEIVRELGRGGMAVVYLARQPDLDRLVALKELAAFGMNDPQMVHRFLREAQIAGSLSDPNIVTVHESFVVQGIPYIAMEYLAPGSLRPLVGHLRVDQSIAIMHDVLSGLAAAEKRNVVHRDLKPENLLLTEDGRVKIADFGIAKAVDKVATAEFKTAAGTTVGTPTYMAPEQAMGTTLTPATDLYSIGVMAYELMVGRLPFQAESPVALLLQHVSDPPPAPLSINPSLDPEIAAWIERLLVKEPAARTGRAAQAWDELEEIVLRLLGARWRRGAALPDPRAFAGAEQPLPAEDDASRYLTVDPERFAPDRPPTGGTDDQSTAVARDYHPTPSPATPPPYRPDEQAPPGPWTPPPSAPPGAVPGPWTPPPSEPAPSATPAGWAPPPSPPPGAVSPPSSPPGAVAPPSSPPGAVVPPSSPPGALSPPPGAVAPPSSPPGAVAPPSSPPGAVSPPPGAGAPPLTPPGAWTPPPSGPPRAVPSPSDPGAALEPDATVAPNRPLPTPAPLETPTAPRRRAGLRRLVWLTGLLAIATTAAVVAFLSRPAGNTTPQATPTAEAEQTARPPREFPTDAFTLTLPAEWRPRCLEEQNACAGVQLREGLYRSAFVDDSGGTTSTLTIDRTQLPAGSTGVTLASVIGRVDEGLVNELPGYKRADGSPRAVTTPNGRAMELSFTSDAPQRRAGTVYVFRNDDDVYVVTGTGPDPDRAHAAAQGAVDSLKPR